ncbi:maltose ABC transporter permease MalF [Andreprevotia chitinilytica]|uniref:maltose ABC transporter permease MalF n=1 Tax=Andreprevotia chitinilytica TaxID=396808 RepID=UPI000A741B3E|nr:maltose ABC transporter permease MalF [Andreprevotia chitinilytica]
MTARDSEKLLKKAAGKPTRYGFESTATDKALAPSMKRSYMHYALAILGCITLMAGLELVTLLYTAHQPIYAAVTMVLLAITTYIYVSPRLYAYRYVVPGVMGVLIFIVFPMLYTLGISFTNYSSRHLLAQPRAAEVLLQKSTAGDASLDLKLYAVGSQYRLQFSDDNGSSFVSKPVDLPLGNDVDHDLNRSIHAGPVSVILQPTPKSAPLTGEPLPLKELIKRQAGLKQVVAVLPDGTELRQSSFTRFAQTKPAYRANRDGTLTDNADGSLIKPNPNSGYYEHADGKPLEPGFRSFVGFQNYFRIFTDPAFHEPFLRIFSWTVTFAGLNTLLTFAIGIVLAVLLNWEALRFRGVYRMMLFLPYAIPAFISIPVFKGLFNENLGEINMVIEMFFGTRPSWFSDPVLAKSMVLIVNTWLAYPYMMILCMGLIKAIPDELYEASALVGAGPLTNFFSITLPLILRPMAPLLIASFAFNFNNLTLITLLTGGSPDFLDTQVPAGATDLLVSYTYRIAFQDSGQNYALACAISSIVFLIVAALAVINLRLFKVNSQHA